MLAHLTCLVAMKGWAEQDKQPSMRRYIIQQQTAVPYPARGASMAEAPAISLDVSTITTRMWNLHGGQQFCLLTCTWIAVAQCSDILSAKHIFERTVIRKHTQEARYRRRTCLRGYRRCHEAVSFYLHPAFPTKFAGANGMSLSDS